MLNSLDNKRKAHFFTEEIRGLVGENQDTIR